MGKNQQNVLTAALGKPAHQMKVVITRVLEYAKAMFEKPFRRCFNDRLTCISIDAGLSHFQAPRAFSLAQMASLKHCENYDPQKTCSACQERYSSAGRSLMRLGTIGSCA
ncbi:MAG: hypothetical protein OXB95_05250 [Rhodobacteraceae bacterium]|nr:hypothetical protein [Paracoccaceae bacterium]